MDVYQATATFISIISLIVSIWNYRRNLTINKQVQLLNHRKVAAEHFSFYVNLIHCEFVKVEELLYILSRLCNDVNDKIGDILGRYDTRDQFSRMPLGYLYADLHRGICETFEHELPWQTVEHLNWRLSAILHLDAILNLDLDPASKLSSSDRRRRWTGSALPRSKATYPELRFLESDPGRSTIVELARSLDATKTDELISLIERSFEPIQEFFRKHAQKLSDSLHVLESGMIKNNLEEFKLRENPKLYRQYEIFKNTLRFLLNPSRMHPSRMHVGLGTAAKHNLVNNIVLLGSTMAMANWLIGETIFSIKNN